MIERIEHLAIAAPRWVGDVVMATPVMEAALGAAHVGRATILVREHLAPLLANGPLEEHTVTHSGRGDERGALAALEADAVLLLSNSFGAAWRAWRAGIPIRAGTSMRGRRALLTHAVVPPMRGGRRAPVPTAHLQRDVAGLLGLEVPDLHPRLLVSGEARGRLAGQLSELGLEKGEDYVVCTPGAAFGAAKLWPPERFAGVLDRLHQTRGWRGVVSGGPGEERLIAAVVGASRSGAISLADVPRGLDTLMALVAGARLLLVGDSGPRWVAAAFDVPCVSIMGPNVPELTATSLELCSIVRIEDLECSPCAERVCPLGHHRCMQDISVERVEAAAEEVLARVVPAASPVNA